MTDLKKIAKEVRSQGSPYEEVDLSEKIERVRVLLDKLEGTNFGEDAWRVLNDLVNISGMLNLLLTGYTK